MLPFDNLDPSSIAGQLPHESCLMTRSPFLESAEKPFVKLLSACFGKLVFQHVFKVTKSKMTVKFDDFNPLRS